jgi:2-methylcitrate dehydratase PrpD
MTILTQLAQRSASIERADIDARGSALVRTAFIDTLGVALAGTTTDAFRIAAAVLGVTAAEGPGLLLGTSHRGPVLDSAAVNAIAAHALDYDDNNIIMAGHPSALLVPAVIALGEQLDATVDDLLVAYAAGYEVMLRVARGVNPGHYEQGWHPTATTGVFGVAAAAARLLRLDAAATTVALAIAASAAAGIKANFGTMVKALHVGQAVRNGLVAANLADAGYTANPAAMEAEQGFLRVYSRNVCFDAEAITAGLDGPIQTNIGFNPVKAFPCCGSTHAAVLASLDLHDTVKDPADVDAIRVAVDPKRIPHTDRPTLRDALAGKFSHQYVVARALLDGRVGLDHFENEAHRDQRVLALMQRVELAPAHNEDTNSFAAKVTVRLRSGDTHSAQASARQLVRISEGQLWDKFHDTAGRVLSPGGLTSVRAALDSFSGTLHVRELTDTMARSACISRSPSRDSTPDA